MEDKKTPISDSLVGVLSVDVDCKEARRQKNSLEEYQKLYADARCHGDIAYIPEDVYIHILWCSDNDVLPGEPEYLEKLEELAALNPALAKVVVEGAPGTWEEAFEDLLDLKAAERALEEHKKDPKTYTFDQVLEELGITREELEAIDLLDEMGVPFAPDGSPLGIG